MATITQRLIAAGASPERARAFEQQFAASRPGLKPQEIQDAFDDQLAAFSAAQYPYTFKPQSLSDAELPDYIIATYGKQKYDEISKIVTPRLDKAVISANKALQNAALDIKDGIDLTEISAAIKDAYKIPVTDPSGKAYDSATLLKLRQDRDALFGGLTDEDVIKQITPLFTEYSNAVRKSQNAAKSFIKTDKYYQANLPHPNLKYGINTDLKTGTIDFRTNPGVKKVLKGIQEAQAVPPASFVPGTRTADVQERRAIAAGRQVSPEDVFKSFQTTKSTPFFDEVKRREFLKGKTTLP